MLWVPHKPGSEGKLPSPPPPASLGGPVLPFQVMADLMVSIDSSRLVFHRARAFLYIMQVLVSQLHFLANRKAELAVPPLFWPAHWSVKFPQK